MSAEERTVAVVGACGGVGATRLTVETAATLARAGRAVCVLDVTLATQGLAGHVAGRVDPDLTRVLVEEAAVEDALVELDLDVAGRVAAVPARAPLERLARAQTAGAARRLTDLLDRTHGFDAVLVDAGSVATNLSIAAVTAADRVGVVTLADERGADALQRVRGRLADAGEAADVVIANRADEEGPLDADAVVPAGDVRAPSAVPACVDPDPEFAPAVARAAETLVGASLELEFPEGGLL